MQAKFSLQYGSVFWHRLIVHWQALLFPILKRKHFSMDGVEFEDVGEHLGLGGLVCVLHLYGAFVGPANVNNRFHVLVRENNVELIRVSCSLAAQWPANIALERANANDNPHVWVDHQPEPGTAVNLFLSTICQMCNSRRGR